MECDDELMVSHIAELLADLSPQKTDGERDKEREDSEHDDDNMDTA